MRFRIPIAIAAVTLLCLAATVPNEARAPEEVLASKGLTKVGATWLVPGDLQLREGLRTMRQAKRKLDDTQKRRSELHDQMRKADEAQGDLLARFEDVSNRMEKNKNVPFRYNELLRQFNELQAQMHDARRFQEDCKDRLAKIVDPSDEYIVAVLDLSEKMEKAARQYQVLAADPQVTSAIAALNQKPGPKFRLGPSSAFAQELPGVRRERTNVNTATVKFNNDANVPQLDVTINGKVTISMVLDSGASAVSLSSEVADRLGLKRESRDPVIKMTIANGSKVDGYVKSLESVRLGPFTVENVECIISSERNAPNLLGGTFLQNFVYHMDLANGQVRLSQIAGKPSGKDLDEPLPPASASAPPTPGSARASGTPPAATPGTPPASGKQKPAGDKWLVIFRSAYPAHWDTPVSGSQSYAIPLDQVPDSMAYLRVRNAEGGYVIIPLTREELQQRVAREKSGWEGRDYDKNGARHLGIFVKSMRRADTGSIDITQGNNSNSGFTGYGFGNRVNKDDRQGYVWAGKPVEKGVLEFAVTSQPLTDSEKANLLSE